MDRLHRFAMTLGMLAGLALFGGASTAEAGFLPVFLGTTPSGPNTSYDYRLDFNTSAGAENLTTGDFVTIYDFEGFVGASSVNPLLSPGTQFLGLNGFGTAPPDDPNVLNVVFSYNGATPLAVDTQFLVSIVSTIGTPSAVGRYSSETTLTTPPLTGLPNGQTGFVTVARAIPEPASVALMGLGTLGLVGAARLRRRAR